MNITQGVTPWHLLQWGSRYRLCHVVWKRVWHVLLREKHYTPTIVTSWCVALVVRVWQKSWHVTLPRPILMSTRMCHPQQSGWRGAERHTLHIPPMKSIAYLCDRLTLSWHLSSTCASLSIEYNNGSSREQLWLTCVIPRVANCEWSLPSENKTIAFQHSVNRNPTVHERILRMR